jgi:hypothetical protein
MADVTGARGTANITQAIRKVDMREAVLELEPNAAPLTVLLGRLATENTHNPKFSWTEDSLRTRFDTINNVGGYTNSATAIVVTNAALYQQHDNVKVTRTGELMYVSAVNTGTNTLTVERGVGGGAAAINNGDELLIIGSSQPEGDTSKPARSGNPAEVVNYTQIHRTPWESTETLRHSDTFTRPPDWNRQANHAGIEHKKSWEYILFHGRPSENTTGSQPRRTTGGVFYFITSNITSVGGAMSETTFWGALRTAFRYGNTMRKTLFASRLVVDVLNTYPRGKLQTVQGADTYGLNVREFISPHGELVVVTHNLLEGTTFGGEGVVLDLSLVRRRVLGNDLGDRDTAIHENIQAPDADTRKDEYKTEAGLEFGLEKAHARFTGVTG